MDRTELFKYIPSDAPYIGLLRRLILSAPRTSFSAYICEAGEKQGIDWDNPIYDEFWNKVLDFEMDYLWKV